MPIPPSPPVPSPGDALVEALAGLQLGAAGGDDGHDATFGLPVPQARRLHSPYLLLNLDVFATEGGQALRLRRLAGDAQQGLSGSLALGLTV